MLISTLQQVANSLQVPVIVLLMALAVITVIALGILIAECFTERKQFKLALPKLIDQLQSEEDPRLVVSKAPMLKRQRAALLELLSHPDATPMARESLAVNLVGAEQAHFNNRVKVTDYIAKVAPMLGLMGTLIPLGPGLMAIGEGDTALLSESLLVAFSTTVLGLAIAALALLISTIHKSWYAKYLAAFESAAECVLEQANAGDKAGE